MNNTYFIPFAITLLLLGTSCESKIPSSPPITKKSAPTSTDTTPAINQADSKIQKQLDQLEARRGNFNRTIWQRPGIILQKLGDLSQKTVADIGAGPFGYFSFQLVSEAKKVIAIDVDPQAIDFMDSMRIDLLAADRQNALEPRLSTNNDPKLQAKEADVIILMNIYAYLPDHAQYLKTLKKGMSDNAQLLIVDFKMRNLPIGPPQEDKIPLFQVEKELEQAGFRMDFVDDQTLDFQYMMIATKE